MREEEPPTQENWAWPNLSRSYQLLFSPRELKENRGSHEIGNHIQSSDPEALRVGDCSKHQ